MTLSGTTIYLRALEPEDLQFLYTLENDESVWEISNTTTPYSKYVLKQYLDNAHRDIFEVKQLRLVICIKEDEKPVGFIDLFEFEPKNKRVGVGILIFSEENRGKGIGSESLQLVCEYAFKNLSVHQVFANITEDNKQSIKIFEKLGFKHSGTKKDWLVSGKTYKTELFYQLINS